MTIMGMPDSNAGLRSQITMSQPPICIVQSDACLLYEYIYVQYIVQVLVSKQ